MADQDDPNAAIAKYNASHHLSDTKTEQFPIPGLEFLGRGYDVFGRYASVDSCKQNIIDFSGADQIDQVTLNRSVDGETLAKAFNQIPIQINDTYSMPKTVTYSGLFAVESVNEFQSTVSEQMRKWSAHANVSGSYGAFGGEIDARFSSNLSKLATTKHYSLVSKSTYWELSLAYSLESPAPLKQEVQDDLDNPHVKCEDFFKHYGTHYLSSVAIGCKVTISCEIDTSRAEAEFDFSSYLKATYEGEGASVGVSADATYQNKVKRFQDYSKTSVFGVGISDDQIEKITAGTESGVSVLKGGWHNPTLIDFPSDALTPIWDYCTDPDRKKQFQDAFDNLAKTHASVISGLSLYKPLYLYRGEVNDAGPDLPGAAGCTGATYRLYPTTNLGGSSDAGGIAWEIQNDGKPFINVAEKQIRGTEPLFAWRLLPDRHVWRFAIGRQWGDMWSPWPPGGNGMEENARIWELVSSTPIGYVVNPYDPRFPRPAGIRAVYLYNSPTVQWVSYYSLDEVDNTRAPREIWKRYTDEFELRWRTRPGSPPPRDISSYPPDRVANDPGAGGPRWLGWSPE